ncbi:MAG: NAD(+)/NADH kinase [Deltaproteobacteria bacterium]|nr:MAG: NAD(+)/NADH kinase [Deltaproteobacteria bacterium]
MIVADERNPRAMALKAALAPMLKPQPEDLCLVIGGDGFLLHTVHTHGLDLAYLGLNAGTLGFLLNDVVDVERTAKLINAGRYQRRRFPVLEGRATTVGGDVHALTAVNDIYLERASGQTARLELTFDGHLAVEALVADGIIFSTAVGSTGYAFSAGATAAHPTLSTLTVTPICPHQPRLPPITLPRGSRAEARVISPERRPVRAVADGRQLEDVVHLEAALGEERLCLAYMEGHDFTARMIDKLMRA